MNCQKIIAILIVLSMLFSLAACNDASNDGTDPNMHEQEKYVMADDLVEMTVDWTVDSADRRSAKFENVVFAGDIVDDWAEQVVADMAAYQKGSPAVEYADLDEISALASNDLIVLSDGLFSLLGGKSAAEYAGQLEETVYQIIDEAGEDAVILVTGLPYISAQALGDIPMERVAEYNAAIRAVAMGADVLYANIYRAQSQAAWAQAEDGMSFSDVGNILVAGEVLQRLMRACTCLAVDGLNELTKSAMQVKAPTKEALQAFCNAQDAEQMRDALSNNRLGVDLDLFRSLDTTGCQLVYEELVKMDRSNAVNYMIADLLVNIATMRTIGNREALDWVEIPFKTYVSVGDSITQGCMAINERTDSWVAHLGELISEAQGKKVTQINRGIGGTKMSTPHQHYPAAKDTVQQYIVSLNPDLITIAYGINDFHAGTTLKTFMEDYRNYLQEVVESCPNAVIIVCGLLYKGNDQDGKRVREWNDAIREMAEEFGVIYCDTYNDMYGINWLLADGLHPNNAGYRVMASTVFRTLCENVNMAE